MSLKTHTSFNIGGPTAFFAVATSAQALAALLRTASRLELPVLVLGGGTNLLIDDRGFDGLAVKLDFGQMLVDEDRGVAFAGASVPTSALVEKVTSLGFEGAAFAAGLPGSVGGGLAGNAGCFGKCLGDILVGAEAVSSLGEILSVQSIDWFQFRYRGSRLLDTGTVLTRATFSFCKVDDKEALKGEAAANIALRRKKHPLPGAFSAGSFFKNLPPKAPGAHREAAGLLLDRVGAREMSVGDAAVFERHANIVINKGCATCKDVLALTDAMRLRVLDRFGVCLEPEVRYVSVSSRNALK